MRYDRQPPQAKCIARRAKPRGAALLVCLFVMAVCTANVLTVLDTQTLQWSALRNSIDYERALYLAGAGVHHALAELEADLGWRDGIPTTEFPAGSGRTYEAELVEDGNDLIITGSGTSGGVTRTLQVVVSTAG